uniref:Ovule protein n=1 Tax=Steinernema glaseri TaxID=37863 RepID=A0A1I7ZXW8_9BILA
MLFGVEQRRTSYRRTTHTYRDTSLPFIILTNSYPLYHHPKGSFLYFHILFVFLDASSPCAYLLLPLVFALTALFILSSTSSTTPPLSK